MRGSAKVWVIAFVVSIVVGFGALIGIGCAVDANACPFKKTEPFTSTNGAEIWAAFCMQCHGPEGRGKSGPSLVTGAPASYTLAQLRERIADGKPLAGMPKFSKSVFGRPALTPQQIEAVARFVIELREAA